MMPTQEDWQQLLRRLEAVEKLAMELLQRVQRLEFRMGIKSITLPTPTKTQEKPEVSVKPEKKEEVPAPSVPPMPEPATPSAPPAPTIPKATPEPEKSPTPTTTPEPTPPKLPTPPQPTEPQPSSEHLKTAFEWEMLLGGKLALWVGAVLVLLAASFGIAYGWQFIGPVGRVLLGVLAGLTFIAVGEFAKGRAAKWFVEGIVALGLALLYLSIWAAAMRYRIVGVPVAFAGMAVVTTVSVAFSVRHDALSLILLATLGGFLTPVILRAETVGAAQTTNFFAYITLLNAGILATSTYKRWQIMNFVTLFATLMLVGGWALLNYTHEIRWQTFAFATVNFLIFRRLRSRLPAALPREKQSQRLSVFADGDGHLLPDWSGIGLGAACFNCDAQAFEFHAWCIGLVPFAALSLLGDCRRSAKETSSCRQIPCLDSKRARHRFPDADCPDAISRQPDGDGLGDRSSGLGSNSIQT